MALYEVTVSRFNEWYGRCVPEYCDQVIAETHDKAIEYVIKKHHISEDDIDISVSVEFISNLQLKKARPHR